MIYRKEKEKFDIVEVMLIMASVIYIDCLPSNKTFLL